MARLPRKLVGMHPLVEEFHQLLNESHLGWRRIAYLGDVHQSSFVRWFTGTRDPQLSSLDRALHPLGYKLAIVASDHTPRTAVHTYEPTP